MRPIAFRALLASVPLVLLLCGCDAPAQSRSAPEPTVADSAGVAIFQFPASALDVRAPRQLAAEPTVRIGVVEGPPEYQWAYPRAAIRLANGGFAVAEGTPAEIRVFDAEGIFERRIGRPGDGPGEFRSPQALAPAPGGGILAWDSRHRRRSQFDAEGTLVSEASLQELSPLRSVMRVALLPDGRMVVVGGIGGADAVSNRGQAREPLDIHAIQSGIEGAGIASAEPLRVGPRLGTVAGDEQEIVTESDAEAGLMSISIASQWYWGRLYTWASPSGLWAADRTGMEARHYRAEGGLDRVIRVDASGPPATPALVDSVEAVEVERWARQMGDDLTDDVRAMIRDDMAGRDYPEAFPAMDAVFSDARGNPWIGLPNPPSPSLMTSEYPEVPRWLVFAGGSADPGSGNPTPAGRATDDLRVFGVVNLPPGSHPLWADDDGVLILRMDPEFGVPYVEWYVWAEG